MLRYFSLKGKTAIVTGSSYGLGRAMACGLAEAGADIVAVSRKLNNLEMVKSEIENVGRKVLTVECDVSKLAQVKNLVNRTIDMFGRIDILVNSAGITIREEAIKYTERDWDKVVDINLKGVFLCCREVGKIMIKQGKGKIINIASLMSFIGGITIPAYAASKGGVSQLTKALSNEWAKYNVNVNAIAPGYFKTPLTQSLIENPERYNEITSRIPMNRWGNPEDLKGAAVFLASDASDYITGHILVVDGGWMGR
ncbi:MAG: SDR family oxidoreductase [Candidatus Helarchaeota archaeon]|nr:SDR family oxidoreductase [Candidatus Helarchaeota archaeon]